MTPGSWRRPRRGPPATRRPRGRCPTCRGATRPLHGAFELEIGNGTGLKYVSNLYKLHFPDKIVDLTCLDFIILKGDGHITSELRGRGVYPQPDQREGSGANMEMSREGVGSRIPKFW